MFNIFITFMYLWCFNILDNIYLYIKHTKETASLNVY